MIDRNVSTLRKLILEALATPIEHGDNASALSLADKFIEEATRLIELNPNSPPHENDEPGQMCFACDEKEACVRLSSCDCQTMFCTDCMIRFFQIFFNFFLIEKIKMFHGQAKYSST